MIQTKKQKEWYENKKLQTNRKCKCGKSIGYTAFQCGSCAAKERSKKFPPPNRKGKQDHLIGQTNGNWKGEDVGYIALHNWVNRNLVKTGRCSKCKKKGWTCWANLSGEYKRDISDWYEACAKCNGSDGIPVHERFNTL